MRVLYLNPFSQQVSGPDESLITLLTELIPLGVEAQLVLPRPGPQVPRYEALGVKVHIAPLTFLKRRMGAFELATIVPRLVRSTAAVARIVRRERIDLVHTNMEVVLDGALATRFTGVPHVLHYRGNTLDRPKLVFDVLTRFWTSSAEAVFCISRATAEVFFRRGLRRGIEVLYNPVDVNVFAAARRSGDVRRQLGAAEGELLLGTVGRIHPRKDVATFLEAGALIAGARADLRLVVVGSAEAPEEVEYQAKLKALAERLGIADRLTWAGARRDMPSVLKSLDVLLLCSRNEGFGRVVAEAIAAGTPVVASNEGAMPELAAIAAGSVLLADPANPRHFADLGMAALSLPAPRPDRSRVFEGAACAAAVHRVYSELVPRLVDGAPLNRALH